MKDFPNKDGNWSWEELETLSKALGFHPKVFAEHLPASSISVLSCEDVSTPSMHNTSIVKFDDLITVFNGDLFYPILNKTFNHQDGAYNLKVVIKAIQLLQKRFTSFSQLRVTRVSFQTYEGSDHAGLEDKYVMRALKLCGKIMAPDRLKQLLQRVDRLVSDRLMLYEFLDLVAGADSLSMVEKKIIKDDLSEKLDHRGLYQVCEFQNELLTQDERCYKELNNEFQEMLKIIPVTDKQLTSHNLSHNKQWATPPLANKSYRGKKTAKSKQEGKLLHGCVTNSNEIVNANRETNCGICFKQILNVVEREDSNNVKSPTSSKEVSSSPIISTTPKLERLQWKKPLLVTDDEISETKQKIQDMQWTLSTRNTTNTRNNVHSSN
eukprot:TCONS_00038210-protein